jgi:Bacterial Ig-like domain (group 1)
MNSHFCERRKVDGDSPLEMTRLPKSSMTYKFVLPLLLCMVASGAAQGQVSFLTSRGDTTRSGANTNETMLTPSNVNKNSFGHLFSAPVDYQVLAQPLYVPQVNIPGQGTHNVVYVVTQANSVYAFDADNGTQLWYDSMNMGGTPASGKLLPCGTTGGFTQEGIIGTPVIDPTTNTMYLVAKSVINGTVTHYLHALDITTGNEQTSLGSPVQIAASSTSIKGHVTTFNSLHQKNRPGLLLLNGVLYLGFGSNGCNDNNSGWILAYSAANVQQQLGAFNTSPDIGLTSIWQTGNGLAADEFGNLFVTTAESTNYDVPDGGQSYSNSVLKITPPPWNAQNDPSEPADYFTPWNVATLNSQDLDVSSVGALVLPDQPGPYPHEVIASGKSKVVYVLDRDNLGMWSPTSDAQIIQELNLTAPGLLMCSPAYWNNMVYFSPDGSPIQVFQLSNGTLVPFAQSPQALVGSHAPSISADGTTNGIVWVITNSVLEAYNAVSLQLLYTSAQDASRDKMPYKPAHFATETVVNGKVYVATQQSLEAYGLLHVLSISSGNNQSAPILTALPSPLQILASDPYSGAPQVGVTVNFSDGGKGGTFNPSSAVTGSNGIASTVYTVSKTAGTYTLTISAANYGSITASETATALAATKLAAYAGAKQSGAAGSTLSNPIVAQARDAYNNPVPGVTINFSANNGGIVNPTSAITNAKGQASTSLQLPNKAGTVTVTASSSGLKSVLFQETTVAASPASVTATGGNDQTAPAGTTLPQTLNVTVADQYGNPVSNASVTFTDNGAGGSFSSNPVSTNSSGVAAVSYTLPSNTGTISLTGSVPGVQSFASFTEISN